MDDWCCRSTLGAAADPQAWPASLDQRRNSHIEMTSTCSLRLTSAFPLLRLGPAQRRGGRGDRRRRDSGERAGSGARGWRTTVSAARSPSQAAQPAHVCRAGEGFIPMPSTTRGPGLLTIPPCTQSEPDPRAAWHRLSGSRNPMEPADPHDEITPRFGADSDQMRSEVREIWEL
jgi:hypothetical protein